MQLVTLVQLCRSKVVLTLERGLYTTAQQQLPKNRLPAFGSVFITSTGACCGILSSRLPHGFLALLVTTGSSPKYVTDAQRL